MRRLMTWERAVIAAVCIACGYAALILSLVGVKAAEDWKREHVRRGLL